MKNLLILLALAAGVPAQAGAGDKEPWAAPYKPLKGAYLIYGGSLGEQQAPTRTDRKVAISIEGTAAKELFDAMQPDEKRTCTDAAGYRERRKGKVSCTYEPDSGYNCYFGFDLRTGKSIGGSIC
ncbi:hypothetical protein [Massilia genomosp. 1]|uniref:DUF3617 domain-containing protein n=1 Tax=Massilia genomosp. 1 TaxID=2609280 RepID=A0ABX0MDD8_9BURK|nr:hypothetical protein [Massilia genomosp. 1]NHZ60773.1 hypothetical protein [Massilia genomosp. 1]